MHEEQGLSHMKQLLLIRTNIQNRKIILRLILSMLLILVMFPIAGSTVKADEPTYTIYFSSNGKTISRDVTLPHSFVYDLEDILSALYDIRNDENLDGVGNPTINGENITSEGNTEDYVIGGYENYYQFITIKKPFTGTAVVTGMYEKKLNEFMKAGIRMDRMITLSLLHVQHTMLHQEKAVLGHKDLLQH